MRTRTIDSEAYAAKLQTDKAAGRCFICELTDEATTPEHEIVATATSTASSSSHPGRASTATAYCPRCGM